MNLINLPKILFSKEKTVGIVFSNTFFQIFGKVVSMTITMLTTVLITRNYGVEGYGYFNLMQSIPAIFFIIVDFGFNAVALNELNKNWENAQKYFLNILVMRILMSFVLILLVGFGIYFFFPYPADLKFGIYLSLFLILGHSLYTTGNLIFQYKLRYDYSVIGYVLGSLVVLVMSLFLIFQKSSIVWVNFSYVFGTFFTFLVSLYYLKKLNIKLSRFKIDFGIWKSIFLASLPLGIMFLFSQVNFRADTILLSKLNLPTKYGLNNVETVAIYGIAYKVFEVCLVLPTFSMNAIYPIYIKKLKNSKEEFMNFFLKTLGILALLGGALTLFGYLSAPLIIKILGGEEFILSITSLQLLFGGISLFFITAPVSYFILTVGKQKYLPIAYGVAAMFNVVLNIYFIPKYSFVASSILTWTSELIILLFVSVFAFVSWKKYTKNVVSS